MIYSASFSAAITAQQDLFEITVASTVAVVLHQIILSQSTELTDAQDEGLRLVIKRGMTTSGSGGTTPTPTTLMSRFAAAASTVEANNTTKSSAGTIVTLHQETWNIRSAFIWLPTPELRYELGPSQRLAVELATTPTDSITVDGIMYFEEIG